LRENEQGNRVWYCPLYKHDIVEGKCLDIQYERLHYARLGLLREVARQTGKDEVEINKTCEECPNQPLRSGLPAINLNDYPEENSEGKT
jgi:hypothetical protein